MVSSRLLWRKQQKNAGKETRSVIMNWVVALLICFYHLGAINGSIEFPLSFTSQNQTCIPGTKMDFQSKTCIPIETIDVNRAMNWLSNPPRTTCQNVTTVQGLSVCEDNLPKDCVIWSLMASPWCNDHGTLEFEKYWSKRCEVIIFHFVAAFKGNVCERKPGVWSDISPNLQLVRLDMTGQRCFVCFYKSIHEKKTIMPPKRAINVLKVSERHRPNERTDDMDGVQYTFLSDMLIHHSGVDKMFEQIIIRATFTPYSMLDSVGREAEQAWNMWGTQRFLRSFASFQSSIDIGSPEQNPIQYSHYLEKSGMNTSVSSYIHSFVRLPDEKAVENEITFFKWLPVKVAPIVGEVPDYCSVPSRADLEEMQEWIDLQMRLRCHPTRLWVTCEHRPYQNFLPCPKELMDTLAEDFAAARGWCNFNSPYAAIVPIKVDDAVSKAFQQPKLGDGSVRLAFFFIVHEDASHVERLLNHLYGTNHYYLLHIDGAKSASKQFEKDLRLVASKRPNVFIAKDQIIVYGASTVTILLTRAMAWFDKFASGWDYLVTLTGSDYPLVPLRRMEKILNYQKPPMPFVMAWTSGTQTHIFRLGKTHPIFEDDDILRRSIEVLNLERGKILGQVPMEFRSGNFGPPLTCQGERGFAHLDNRRNDTGRFDTQWLFPRDKWPRRGRATVDEDPNIVIPAVDNVFRVWKKSDPAFSAVYDRETINYIVNSEEGKKYYHFFKHMLLGSEEHYYVSLLYNWKRTRAFVSTISAQAVWNTWELGQFDKMSGGFRTHTHYLSEKEWSFLQVFVPGIHQTFIRIYTRLGYFLIFLKKFFLGYVAKRCVLCKKVQCGKK